MAEQIKIDEWLEKCEDAFDIASAAQQERLLKLADDMLQTPEVTVEMLSETAKKADSPLEFRIAVMLVKSKLYVNSIQKPVHITVVFAMWGEQNRLKPKSESNPNGEDALRMKIKQLEWACAGTNVTWSIYAVDDGCPYKSGNIAEEIAAESPKSAQVHVAYLKDAIPTETGPLRNLESVLDSKKGGAVIYGSMLAIKNNADAVVYTDADNSVHLGQIGLLLKPFIEDKKKVVLGNRKHPESVLVKDAARWGIGIKNLRHMQRMAGHAIFSRNITDTQAAFKLYESQLLKDIIETPTVYDFSFDTDWIAAFISKDIPFAQTPFAFIDSAAESATAKQIPMTTWETLLNGLVSSMKAYDLLKSPHSYGMAKVIEEEVNDYRDLEKIIDHLPKELEKAAEKDYGNPEVMTHESMRKWIRRRKQS